MNRKKQLFLYERVSVADGENKKPHRFHFDAQAQYAAAATATTALTRRLTTEPKEIYLI